MNPKDLLKKISSVTAAAATLLVGTPSNKVDAKPEDNPPVKIPKSRPTILIQKLILHSTRARQALYAYHSSHSSHSSHASHYSGSGSGSYSAPTTAQPSYTPPIAAPATTQPAPVKPAANTPKATSSDVDVPQYKMSENPENFAVVIGIEKYPSLPAAEFAERDAKAVVSHLTALGYPTRNIYFPTGDQATRGKIAQSLNTWLPNRVGANSTVFFYFSGHGATDPQTNQAYLVTIDGDPEDLDSTAYPINQLYTKLGKLKARRVIVALDSCFSGAGGRSVLARGARPLVNKIDLGVSPGNVITMTASDKSQISGTLDEQKHGTFTYFLLKGLQGKAKNGSGHITALSLYEYLKPKVEDAARLHNRDQIPQLFHTGEGVDASSVQLR